MTVQLTLGEFVKQLKSANQENVIVFDTYSLDPTSFDSYRGYYRDLALGFNQDIVSKSMTVAELLAKAKRAIGETFSGYKGGDFKTDRNTKMWVANYGDLGRKIVGVKDGKYNTIIKTEAEDSDDD